MKTLKLIFLTLLFTASIDQLKAQTTEPAYSTDQLKAAERLLNAQDIVNTMQKSFAAVIQNQALSIPEDKRAAFADVMLKFLNKYLTTDAVIKGLAPVYASEYSIDEMNKISDFLLTPAGKAMTAKQSDIGAKSMKWGQEIAQSHKDELQTMMQDAFKDK